MLLNILYFEQFIAEPTLKKGLRLFESGSIEPVGSQQGGNYQFLVDGNFTLSINKKGEELLSYSCSCHKKIFCEHLAAVLFYFQKDALELLLKKKIRKQSQSKNQKAAKKPGFEIYSEAIENVLNLFSENKALGQKQLDEICDSISGWKTEIAVEEIFDYNLALAINLPAAFNWRITGNDECVRITIKTALQELDGQFSAGLSAHEKNSWYEATIRSIKNNTVIKSEIFLFLIPRLLAHLHESEKFEKLVATLNSRKLKVSYTDRFDKLLIAKLEVALASSKIFVTSFPVEYHPSAIERIIAKAELDFSANKTGVAFQQLSAHYETIKQHHSYYYSAYLDYIIEKAREKNKRNIELSYLKKSIVHNVHIQPAHLARLIELVPEKEMDDVIREIISWLKLNASPFAFDKIADLLYSSGKLDELIDEIRKSPNRFSLLHKVALAKLPFYDDDLLSLYMDHLMQAMTEAGFYQFQQHIFDKAKEYIDQLPENISENFIYDLSEKIGKTKQIGRYILSSMDSRQ